MSLGSDVIALARSKAGQWYYTNDSWARMNPEESGGTDCSGFARWCYLQFGVDIGTWTGDESSAGYEIARGHYPSEIPWGDMQPGDLILMTATYWDNYQFNEYACHIELYCGGGTMIGHPGGYGPQEKWAQAWMESYGCITWMVRRVFDDGHETSGDAVLYRVSTDPSGSYWYAEMQDGYDTGGSTDDFAGSYGEPIRWVAIQGATYRVRSQASGWLPWVSSYNVNDLENGCAGDGSPIVALEIENGDIRYAVHVLGGDWYADMIGQHDTGGSSDSFAGDMWNQIDAVRIRRY